MFDYLPIYLFVKLDDIRIMMEHQYELTFVIALFCAIFIIIKFFCNDEYYQDVDIANNKKEKFEVFNFIKDKHCNKPFKLTIIIWLVQLGISITSIMLPSTGQMAAIYLGTKATKSDTAAILGRLPKKYATLIESKADEWLKSQTLITTIEDTVATVDTAVNKVKDVVTE